ncbi:LOW QUALITY PROTEIN: hypothetical protein V1477_001640 [Vespula maculifrons]|uniref:Uncharacterized protein n=1 Tax=Vespula maculifrons TaxID=7453 RepID=A0ABD2CYC6_VESMC
MRKFLSPVVEIDFQMRKFLCSFVEVQSTTDLGMTKTRHYSRPWKPSIPTSHLTVIYLNELFYLHEWHPRKFLSSLVDVQSTTEPGTIKVGQRPDIVVVSRSHTDFDISQVLPTQVPPLGGLLIAPENTTPVPADTRASDLSILPVFPSNNRI